MRAVPSFKALQSMDNREVIRMMCPQMGCYKCGRNSGLNIVEVGEMGRNDREGLRKVGAVIHCPSCGLLDRKMEVIVPTTPQAYAQLFEIGCVTGHMRANLAAYKPPKSKWKSGMEYLRKAKLDHLVDDRRPE